MALGASSRGPVAVNCGSAAVLAIFGARERPAEVLPESTTSRNAGPELRVDHPCSDQ